MPPLALQCIDSWQRFLPDYEMVLWSEDNFDLTINQYVKEAYEAKKFAFVTDYVRLYALYHYGGVYMDTDVEVLKSLDPFLHLAAFSGCESENWCVTGLIGSTKSHPWIKGLLDQYNGRRFRLGSGRYDLTTNTKRITQFTQLGYGWKTEDSHQILKDGLNIFPSNVFCAKNPVSGEIRISDDTYTVHHFSGSWLSDDDIKRSKRKAKLKSIFEKAVGKDRLEALLEHRRKMFE